MGHTIILPLPRNVLNRSGDPKRMGFAKRDYIQGTKRKLGAKALALGQVRGARLPLQRVEVGSTFYMHNRMDDDNLKARLKWAADALVQAGIIVDDGQPHCKLLEPEQAIDQKNKRLELVVTETKEQHENG